MPITFLSMISDCKFISTLPFYNTRPWIALYTLFSNHLSLTSVLLVIDQVSKCENGSDYHSTLSCFCVFSGNTILISLIYLEQIMLFHSSKFIIFLGISIISLTRFVMLHSKKAQCIPSSSLKLFCPFRRHKRH